MPEEHRLAPLRDEDWPEAVADLRAGFAGQLNVYRVMAHNPELLRAWAPLRDYLVTRNRLGAALSEVVILRAAHRLGSSYEWDQHVVRARAAGLEDAQIAALRGPLEALPPDVEPLARAVDELTREARLTPDTAQALQAAHGAPAMLEVMALVGFYSTLGFILKTCEVPLDGDIAQALADAPLEAGAAGAPAAPLDVPPRKG